MRAEVHFVKLRPEPVTGTNVHQLVMVSSMLQSPIHSLYHQLHNVYAPALLKDAAWAGKLDQRLQGLLAELDAGLASTVRRGAGMGPTADGSGDGAASLMGILAPTDEFDFWQELSTQARTRERAQAFCQAFDPIRAAFADLRRLDLQEALELVEDTQNALDDLWRVDVFGEEPYPQRRMAHLFGVIAGAFARFVQHRLGSMDVWTHAFSEVRAALRDAARLCERWSQATEELTGTYWATLIEHPWEGSPHRDVFLAELARRLDEVLHLRTTHEELLRLLPRDAQRELRVDEAFRPFEGLHPLHYNPYTQPDWEAAVALYERRLAPMEQRVAAKLRQQAAGLGGSPLQQLRAFLRFGHLLARPTIRAQLVGERETLLGQLLAYCDQLGTEFDASLDTGRDAAPGRNLSHLVASLVWCRQAEAKVASLLAQAGTLLGDLSGFPRFRGEADGLLARVRAEARERFMKWMVFTEEGLAGGQLSLEMTGRLMDISAHDGNLVVNFSEQLVLLLREVRQLRELGFDVPARIQDAAAGAERFYRFGVSLKKVANFFNTIDSQIIPAQRQLLLDSLVEFETEVKPQGSDRSVKWSDPAQCELYVAQLQRAAERLSSENRRLRKVHARLAEEVAALGDVDLLRQREQWRVRLAKLQELMGQVAARYPEKRIARWRLHWDLQLYKALEACYCLGLESLNENLPEIKAELVFTHRRIQFRPPVEELRSSYYREMKKFISVPTAFAGFGAAQVYRRMADTNGASLVQVYRKSELLFSRLEDLVDRLAEWVLLGTVADLDAFVERHVASVAAWEANFAALKERRRKADKIPDFFKVDCFSVSAAPLKATVEDQLQRLGDALVLSLRKSLVEQLRVIDEFLDSATQRLGTRPHSVEEIAAARAEWQAIATRKAEVHEALQSCEEKKKLLLTVAGNRVDLDEVRQRLAALPGRWETFEIALEAFNDMVEEQQQALKGELEQHIVECNVEVDRFKERWHALKPRGLERWDDESVQGVLHTLQDWREQFDGIKERTAVLAANCQHFQIPVPAFPGVAEVEADMEAVERAWGQYEVYHKELAEMAAQDWITFRKRLFDLQDFVTQWQARLKGQTARDAVAAHVVEDVERVRRALPGLKYCKGDVPFNDTHWKQLFKRLGIPRAVRLEELTFGHFLRVLDAVEEHTAWCKELTARATGEVRIREAMVELKEWADNAELELVPHECLGRTTQLITGWKDLFNALGDNQSLLSSLKDSPYFRAFADEAAQFEAKFAALDEHGHLLSGIQRKWLYLEPIFGRGALPSEQARFRRVDDEFVDIMAKVATDSHALVLCDEALFPGMRDTLRTMLDQLERCQKALSEYLEDKRSRMPRFYFIGDDDLLEILGQAQNPEVIQRHLKKLFQGVHKVEFSADQAHIVAMCSVYGEVVPLARPVAVTDRVEEWLDEFAREMKSTLRELLRKCVAGPRDLVEYPSQILCLSEQVLFTQRCEAALRDRTLPALAAQLRRTLHEYAAEDLTAEPLLQLKVKALMLDVLHMVDVVEFLQSRSAPDPAGWAWQKQLRCYQHAEHGCVVRMCDAEFEYTFEYQGNAPKLVHTPLTDKCYLTLTQGMHQGFGGNPYGPAGTGKTESVKALGQAMGRQVLVFNCDEGIDFQSMGRIFLGLVKCGAWGCFDEFNRLKEDQLSAVSQQIQVIQDAIKAREPALKLLDRTVNVDHNAGIFVTMNPAGKGYGGRSKLPDNLKQLFRPVAMSLPNNDLIAEAILYSEGFAQARELGPKLVSIFTLSRQLLSPQQHYDWGLRAMKAVLVTGGRLITESKRAGMEVAAELERELLIKAVRVNTLSKLTFADSQRFLAIIKDVFPATSSRDLAYEELTAAIREVMQEKRFGLEFDDGQVRKMLQLKEALDQRMGCVVVGPSGCGKSTLWQVLKAALEKLGQPIITHVMNPKSMPRQRLLGHMDVDTREWSDGVLTAAARQVVKEPLTTRSWIVCDGDVDPEWIESLNSVLDDNHLLTLPNGERISFGANVNFLFETHDLRFASPATISRMGMIFLSDEDVDVRRLVRKWLHELPEEQRLQLGAWVDDFFYRALDWVLRRGECIVDTTMVGTVRCGLSHLHDVTTRAEFLCGLVRGLGANMDLPTRAAFAKEVLAWAGERAPDPSAPLDCYAERGELRALVPPRLDAGALCREDLARSPVIPTVSVQRDLRLVEGWVDRMEPFILVGPEGAGKNMLLQHVFAKRRGTRVTTLHCSAQTTAEHVIQKLQQTCALFSSNAGPVYRPRDCDRLVLYLKDINLPKPDQYNTCMLIALLQQLITFRGFYDDKLEFLGVERVHIVCSMNPATTVGRHALSTRFTAIVRIAYIDYPSQRELVAVYSAFLQAALRGLRLGDARWQQPATMQRLAQTMVELYEQARAKFSVDEHRHYLFTPRELTQWVLGLLRYDVAGEELLDIWVYEAQRLFRDRLVDAESESRFDSLLAGLLRAHWKHTPDLADSYFSSFAAAGKRAGGSESKMGEGGAAAGGGAGGGAVAEAGAGRDGGASLLLRVPSKDLQELVRAGLVQYEREEKDLRIHLFPEVLDHMARVDRVLAQPGGSLLLVGHSGVGRRTSVTLAAHMHGMRTFSPHISRDYSVRRFCADLKEVLAHVGVAGEPGVLYMEDHQFTEPAILETVNSLLSSGEVPGLYSHEELEALLAPLKDLLGDEGGFRYRTPYELFLARISANLHVALGMDPANPAFGLRCESNPALFTRCSILWMGEWRRASMRQLPRQLLPDLLGGLPNADALVERMVAVHERSQRLDGEGKPAARAGCATPRDYVAFLEMYRELYASKSGRVDQDLRRLQAGLSKLQGASATVDELSGRAETNRVVLREKQAAADEAMEQITRALVEAQQRRGEVEKLQQQLAVAEAETLKRKAEIEEQLGDITPVLEAAKQAVNGIQSQHLTEIRSLKMPPEAIHDVLSAVLMLLGINDMSWLSMKKFLGGRGVKDDIMYFDAHRVTPDIRKNVSKLLKTKAASFDDANIERVSAAAAPMAKWVKANIRYSLVLQKIEPLEMDLREATTQLDHAQQQLQDNQRELEEIDQRVKRMQREFQDRTREAEQLRMGLAETERVLAKARLMLDKLGGEQARWEAQVRELRGELDTLPSQILLAAAFCTYLARTPEDTRARALREWMDVCEVPRFDFAKLMSTESELLTWKADGLPGDALSMENALVILHSELRTPFIIDPATAATRWLQRHLAKDGTRTVEALNVQHPKFQTQVELAVRFGKTLIVTEVDRLEPMLYPLVRRDFTRQGPRLVVQIGDKAVDFHEAFRLYLVTRNPTPDLPPDAAPLVAEVNFTVTRSGLEGQLLGTTIRHEQPELERQKSEMLRREEDFKVQLARLEQELLAELASSEGNLLENDTLVESLTKTKEKSAEIARALQESARASEELDRQRDVYRPFARAGSTLYFLICELASLDHMYRFSLQAFVELFCDTLAADMEARAVEERIKQLAPMLERRVLLFVARSLFKADRLAWALHLVHGMRPDLFEGPEWRLFLGDFVAELGGEADARDMPRWVAPERTGALRALRTALPRLVGLLGLHEEDLWARWARAPDCEAQFPPSVARRLSPFQRVLVVQALRPDRLQSAMQQFVCEALGTSSVSPPPVRLQQLVDEVRAPGTPILMLTSSGADPTKELAEFAASVVGADRYFEMAMGGGTQHAALVLLRDAAKRGDWLCFKNLHLVTAWLPVLEKELNALEPHKGFRLWLTTEPHPSFPPILLQQSLKVTFEAPPGLKKNLQRTYEAWTPEFIAQGSPQRAQALFLLAWFHAIVQERRNYIPQGWSTFYEFSFGDLRAGAHVVEAALSRGGRVNWASVHGLMESAIYGGRVSNPFDGRVLAAYLRKCFSECAAHPCRCCRAAAPRAHWCVPLPTRSEALESRGATVLVRPHRLPEGPSHAEYWQLISKLPDVDHPAVFGLPDNIDRSLQVECARN